VRISEARVLPIDLHTHAAVPRGRVRSGDLLSGRQEIARVDDGVGFELSETFCPVAASLLTECA
jgi:hypothetical protein